MNGETDRLNESSSLVCLNSELVLPLEEQLLSLTVTLLHCCSFYSTHASRQLFGLLFLLLSLEGHTKS